MTTYFDTVAQFAEHLKADRAARCQIKSLKKETFIQREQAHFRGTLMRWRKVNRNKRRMLARRRVQIEPRYFMRNPDILWQEWLNKLLPTMLSQTSISARMLGRSGDDTLSCRTRMPIPRLPPFRGMRYDIDADPRRSGAYQGQSRYFMIVDDLDDEPLNHRGSRMFWGDTFMVKIPDPVGLRDDSKQRQ